MKIIQKTINIASISKGFHLITEEIVRQLPEMASIKSGMAFLFLQHTSASLTINEDADPSVRSDMSTFYKRLVPEEPDLYTHMSEGIDDITAHIKTSLLGSNISLPITDGRFNLGTWQGIYLCEHRNTRTTRRLVITIIGE